MLENIPIIEKEKTKEELLEEFKASLEKHGIEGVKVNIVPEGITIEQELGSKEALRGLSKSDRSIWLCLDQNDPGSSKGEGFTENSKLDIKEDYLGLAFMQNENGELRIKIDADYRVIRNLTLV